MPEVTLVLVQDKPTAGWASTNTTAGSSYFQKSDEMDEGENIVPVQYFYTNYITPIIQTILQKG